MTPKQYMMTWLREHRACEPALALAEKEASSLDDAWQRAPRGDWVVWLATRPGVLDDRMLRKFMCFCARQVWPLLTDQRSRNAVVFAERHADGLATDGELAKARDAAYDAQRASGSYYAAGTATRASELSDIGDSAEHAAWSAYSATCFSPALSAMVRAEQARWLRERATPNWGHGETDQ